MNLKRLSLSAGCAAALSVHPPCVPVPRPSPIPNVSHNKPSGADRIESISKASVYLDCTPTPCAQHRLTEAVARIVVREKLRAKHANVACFFLLFLLKLVAPIGAYAAVSPSSIVQAAKTSTPPPNDAALTDPAWNAAVRATDFENATTRQPARLKTTALLLYDDDNLYVGFVSEQPGVPITEMQASNDVGYGVDDEVTVSIDTSGNNSRVYSFTANPLGVRYESSSESTRFQPRWSAIAKVRPEGYNVLMTIPLADMRVGNARTQHWRLNFSRYVAGNGDLLSWAYDASSASYCSGASAGATVYCDATRWPVLADITLKNVAKAPPPYADVYGLASLGRDRNVFETTPENFTQSAPRHVGVDAPWGTSRRPSAGRDRPRVAGWSPRGPPSRSCATCRPARRPPPRLARSRSRVSWS